jgi:hypothetical protein
MPVPNEEGHQMKRIVLPSGKTIEVVYFESHAPAVPAGAPEAPSTDTDSEAPKNLPVHVPAEDTRDLHVCVNCESDLVYPVQWEESGPEAWNILLRCPDCEWSESGVFPQGQCDRFDDELEAGTEALSRDFKRLVTANMAEEIERFIQALDADAIQPFDF